MLNGILEREWLALLWRMQGLLATTSSGWKKWRTANVISQRWATNTAKKIPAFAKRMTATWVKILRICYHNLFGFTTLSSYFWKFHQWPHHKRVTYPAKRLHSACGQSHMRACLHPRFCSAFSVVYRKEMNSINMCTTITSTNLSNQYQYIPLWFMFKRCWNVTLI